MVARPPVFDLYQSNNGKISAGLCTHARPVIYITEYIWVTVLGGIWL